MDFKEVYSKKKGKTYVFCNFEELLTEYYGVKSIEETKQYINSNGEYIIRCPLCKHEHTKDKLYIKEDLTVGHCFLCDREYINLTDKVDVSYDIPKFFGFWGGNQEGQEIVPLTDPTWSLDRFKYEFEEYDEAGYNYLLGRHGYMKDLYKILGFKFWEGNIAIPFFYHGELIYYQIRFTGPSKIRYFFPPISRKPVYILDHAVKENRLIICEGVFDAIACLIMAPEYIPIAVLGSSVSDYQLEMIREYTPKEIKIYMDETKLSVGIANRLKTVIDYCPIHIIPSEGEDPEENMKRILKRHGNLQWIKPKEENKIKVNNYYDI